MKLPPTTASPLTWPKPTTAQQPVQTAKGANPAVSPPARQPAAPPLSVSRQQDTFEASPGPSQFAKNSSESPNARKRQGSDVNPFSFPFLGAKTPKSTGEPPR